MNFRQAHARQRGVECYSIMDPRNVSLRFYCSSERCDTFLRFNGTKHPAFIALALVGRVRTLTKDVNATVWRREPDDCIVRGVRTKETQAQVLPSLPKIHCRGQDFQKFGRKCISHGVRCSPSGLQHSS
jgi:hypothetical protein